MRFTKFSDKPVAASPALFIAALNILLLSVLLFIFQAQFGAAGYGIESVLAARLDGAGQPVEIRILEDGRVGVNGSSIPLEELDRFLAQLRSPSRSFLIVCPKAAAFEQVTRVWEACRRSGAQRVYLVTGP